MEFLKANKRFSFKLGDKNSWDLNYKSEIKEDGNTLITTYYFEGGLKVTNIAKKYEKFGAYEWVNYLENTSDTPTDIISELWDCSCMLPMLHEDPMKWQANLPDVNTATKVYAPSGCDCTKTDFSTDVDKLIRQKRINYIYPGVANTYRATGGRSSSEEHAPFFNVFKNDTGYIFAIGWSGQWTCSIGRTEEEVIFNSKIEDTNFKLLPGEKFRTSSVVIMPYKGNLTASHNKWRRLVKEHFSLIGKEGREKYGPLCSSIWGGMKSEAAIHRINKMKENNLPIEYVWMDAGWYGADTLPTPDEFEGDWSKHTGDWMISPFVHPNGLKDVSDAIHDAGMKFLLWVEPERAICTTTMVTEHPDYFLFDGDENNNNRLLNLGNDDAWNYSFQLLSNLISELNVDCYRQDFNIPPLKYWQRNDTPDRQGITEIKHINGLYRLWDTLLEKYPNLIIDNCAGGGRRIDIETLRRSMPMWRSDYQCPINYDIEASQCHHLTYNLWMPYSGTGTGRIYDEYRIRSAYDSSINMNYAFSEKDGYCDTKERTDFLKKYSEEYIKVRPYFCEDFYPLTESSDKLDIWCAVQFDRPSQNDGIIQVFRREKSPYETAIFTLGAIDENRKYIFTDIDGGEFSIDGKKLAEEGLEITIKDKRCAKIFFYKSV